MLLPIRKSNGLVYRTLICDHCRKPIKESDFKSATVDFFSIDEADILTASYDTLKNHAIEHHFHDNCAPAQCTRTEWAKVFRVMPAMVANLFNAKGSPIGKAALAARRHQIKEYPDPSFP